jgi:hypothetical protein
MSLNINLINYHVIFTRVSQRYQVNTKETRFFKKPGFKMLEIKVVCHVL